MGSSSFKVESTQSRLKCNNEVPEGESTGCCSCKFNLVKEEEDMEETKPFTTVNDWMIGSRVT